MTSNALPYRLLPATLRLLWLFAAALSTCLMLAAPAHAAPLGANDEKSVRMVVESQLAALAKDDAVKAFSFAAPNVRETIKTADVFLAMVRSDYPVVYRPTSVAFLKPEGKDGIAIQRVQMTDAEGTSWLAVYSLAQQKNKTWRITGCSVSENKGRMA